MILIKILIVVWQHSPQCGTLRGMLPSSYHDDLHQHGTRRAERATIERGTPHSLYLSRSLALSLERESKGAREPLDEASARARRKEEKIISFVLAEILLVPLLKPASVLKKQAGHKNRIPRPDFNDFLARMLPGRGLGTL